MNRRQWLRTALAAGEVLLPTAVGAVPQQTRSLWDHDFSSLPTRTVLIPLHGRISLDGPRLRYTNRSPQLRPSWWSNAYPSYIYPSIHNGRLVRQKLEDFHRLMTAGGKPLAVVIEVSEGRFEAVDIERGLLLGPVAVR